MADVGRGRAEVVATDIGRSVGRDPSTGAVSFVQREGTAWTVQEYDPATHVVRTVVPAREGSSDRAAAWGPDGTLFMTRGGEVHYWRVGQAGGACWRRPASARAPGWRFPRWALDRPGRRAKATVTKCYTITAWRQ